ncbi:MAG TPA: FAD-dependent monooxygenase [Burkholderiales bacterium]|nr:FAD-dependent monooxygenase [Burkholderiales bacterium]
MPPESAAIVIVGGGPVGAALALALRASSHSVLLLEARETTANDPRPLALSHGSRLILERLKVWSAVKTPTPILNIHISQRGGFGSSRLTAQEADVPALGYVVSYAELQSALQQALHGLEYLTGANVVRIEADENAVSAEFTHRGSTRKISAELLVLADGGRGMEGVNGIKLREKDYHQCAVVTQVKTELPHRNMAFERFTPQGPVALLPFGEQFALVWATAPEDAGELLKFDDTAFLQRLHEHFGDRLGKFVAAAKRASFPLKLKYAADPTAQRVVILGNAAQTLHPVAGQGFNLGLRDAWELSEVILRTATQQLDTAEMLNAYRQRRKLDRGGGIFFTDMLLRIFSNDLAPLRAARGMALTALDVLPAAKRFLMRRMIFGARG